MDDLQNEIKATPKKRGRPRKDSVVKWKVWQDMVEQDMKTKEENML